MKTGLILISISFVLFVVLSFISRGRKKDTLDFEIDDLSDLHTSVWFSSDAKQFIFRITLAISFCLYGVGVIVFALNCFPEFGFSWEIVILRLFAAFFGCIIAGKILIAIANGLAFGIPVMVITILYLLWKPIDWLLGRD